MDNVGYGLRTTGEGIGGLFMGGLFVRVVYYTLQQKHSVLYHP